MNKTQTITTQDVTSRISPVGNYIVIMLLAVVFAIQFLGDPKAFYLTGLILQKASFQSLIGYSWLHMDPLHLISNILLLAVFGKTACTQLGAGKYFLIYVLLGVISGLGHLALDERAAIGSSGAISGIMGLSIVLSWKKLSPFAPWIVLIWVVATVIAAIAPSNPDASIAHLTGFIAGMLIAMLMVITGHADSRNTDETLKTAFSLCSTLPKK